MNWLHVWKINPMESINRAKLVCEELKKIEGLTTQQRVRVGLLISRNIHTTNLLMQMDYDDKKLLVNYILAENSMWEYYFCMQIYKDSYVFLLF